MDTLQNRQNLESIKRWRLGWILTSFSALTLMILAIGDQFYEDAHQLDGVIDLAIIISSFCLLLFCVYLANKNNRILMRIHNGELSPEFYQNLTEKDYCSNCGHRLMAGANYCEYCGSESLVNPRS